MVKFDKGSKTKLKEKRDTKRRMIDINNVEK